MTKKRHLPTCISAFSSVLYAIPKTCAFRSFFKCSKLSHNLESSGGVFQTLGAYFLAMPHRVVSCLVGILMGHVLITADYQLSKLVVPFLGRICSLFQIGLHPSKLSPVARKTVSMWWIRTSWSKVPKTELKLSNMRSTQFLPNLVNPEYSSQNGKTNTHTHHTWYETIALGPHRNVNQHKNPVCYLNVHLQTHTYKHTQSYTNVSAPTHCDLQINFSSVITWLHKPKPVKLE